MKYRQDKVLQLLDQHGEKLHRLLARFTRCEHTTRDLMQELFIRLSKSSGFERAVNPYAYAWKSAVNLAFRWHKQKKENVKSLESVQLIQKSDQDALDEIIQKEEIQRVLQVTATFRELARNVLVMRFIEEQSYEEIAERLGKNPDYLRALCSKTLKLLKDKLNQKFSDSSDRQVCYE